MRMVSCHSPLLLVSLSLLGACTVNPVTGDRELAIISESDEISIGAEQYFAARQMGGGDYRLDPALSEYVAGVGRRIANVSDRALPFEFSIINSSVPNAWALPGGKIALNRGLLLALDSEAELAAVLSHEIVHAAARHGAQALQRGMLLQSAIAVTARQQRSSAVTGAATLGAQLINQRNGRGAELEADRYGMRYMHQAGYDPAAAVTLQETFLRLADTDTDSGWLAGLLASHPPSTERIERNRSTAATLTAGGELGQQRYAAATAGLRASAAAYGQHDAAREGLAAGRLAEARSLASRALAALPAEALFHALMGDIEFADGRYAAAIAGFSAAQARDSSYFYYPLRLGYAQARAAQEAAAISALEQSLSLLPTAEAHFALGYLRETGGENAAALAHYRSAAEAEGDAADRAGRALLRLALGQRPDDILELTATQSPGGRLQLRVHNPTPLAVADILIVATWREAGNERQATQRVAATLEAGGTVTVTGPQLPAATPYALRIAAASVLTPAEAP